MTRIQFGDQADSKHVHFEVETFGAAFIGIDMISDSRSFQQVTANISAAEARTLRHELKKAIKSLEGRA